MHKHFFSKTHLHGWRCIHRTVKRRSVFFFRPLWSQGENSNQKKVLRLFNQNWSKDPQIINSVRSFYLKIIFWWDISPTFHQPLDVSSGDFGKIHPDKHVTSHYIFSFSLSFPNRRASQGGPWWDWAWAVVRFFASPTSTSENEFYKRHFISCFFINYYYIIQKKHKNTPNMFGFDFEKEKKTCRTGFPEIPIWKVDFITIPKQFLVT